MSPCLATIFTQEENDFVFSLVPDVNGSIWLGGSDAEDHDNWSWISGEQFWTGGSNGNVGPDILYANWSGGNEPSSSAEHYLSMYGGNVGNISALVVPGAWNDLVIDNDTAAAPYRIRGYFVEYDLSSIPIPPAIYLFGSGLLGLIGIARKKAT
jgi:hypothetical protein